MIIRFFFVLSLFFNFFSSNLIKNENKDIRECRKIKKKKLASTYQRLSLYAQGCRQYPLLTNQFCVRRERREKGLNWDFREFRVGCWRKWARDRDREKKKESQCKVSLRGFCGFEGLRVSFKLLRTGESELFHSQPYL